MTSLSAPGSTPHGGGRIASFTARIRNLLVHPWREWRAIAVEPLTAREICLGYVAPLAGAAAAATFLFNTLVGVEADVARHYATPLPAFAGALVGFVLALLGVLLLSRIAAWLAAKPGEDLRLPAMRVIAYSLTPVWLAAIAFCVPILYVPAIVAGLYGVFLLVVGLRTVLRCSPLHAIGNGAVVAVSAWAYAMFMTFAMAFAGGMFGVGQSTVVHGTGNVPRLIGAAGGILGRIVVESDADGRARMAGAVGDLFGSAFDTTRGRDGTMHVFDQLMVTAAVIGGAGRKLEPVPPETLAMLLPNSLAGMWRLQVTSRPENVKSLRGSLATARYENSEGAITLTVADSGEGAGLSRLYAWFNPYLNRTTEWGYERIRRVDGQILKEFYNRSDRQGKLQMLFDERFVITAEGVNVEDKALLDALHAIDARMLASFARP